MIIAGDGMSLLLVYTTCMVLLESLNVKGRFTASGKFSFVLEVCGKGLALIWHMKYLNASGLELREKSFEIYYKC